MKTAAIHFVNESWIFDMIFSVFKPLLGKRYREMVSNLKFLVSFLQNNNMNCNKMYFNFLFQYGD